MHYNHHMRAYLDDVNYIVVQISKDFYSGNSSVLYLKDNTNKYYELIINERVELENSYEYRCYINYDFVIGNTYYIYQEHSLCTVLQYRFITKRKSFSDQFTYNDDLGVEVADTYTIFRIWAPTASRVTLVLDEENYSLKRVIHGVYVGRFEQNLHLSNYYYLVEVNGQINKSLDPYGVASGSNSQFNTVVDFTKLDDVKEYKLSKQRIESTSIIEVSIRDLTNGYIENKSTFLAAGKSVSNNGHPIGFDYITSLGFSHVQLLPVNDFVSVDEDKPDMFYNWGYDPLQYFTLEGSYSTDPSNPLERIESFRKLVSQFHLNGMRVNLDVVFNHVYDYHSSIFQQVVPYYYFRYDDNYELSNGSYCGNDLDTSQPMVRKLIIDCLEFYVKNYDIDGFRFDLLGIIDTETSRQISKKLRLLKNDVILYGEGWEMPTALMEDEMSTIYNGDQLVDYSFFNDYFRDSVGGSIFMPESSLSYLLGDYTKVDSFINCLKGINPLTPTMKYQLINYVECHDNYTLWDSLVIRLKNDDDYTRSLKSKLISGAVVLSQGIPFIQLGQEFRRTKQLVSNSYRSPDSINRIDWDLMIINLDMVEYFKELLSFRNRYSSLWSTDVTVDIEIKSDCLYYHLSNTEHDITVIFNPTNSTHIYDDKYCQLFTSDYVSIVSNSSNVVYPYSLVICEMKL